MVRSVACFIAASVTFSVVLGGCGVGSGERRSFGDGSLPLAERESVEQFEARFYPAYRALIADVEREFQTTGYRGEPSAISGVGEGANLYFPEIVFPTAMSCEKIMALANQRFSELGFGDPYRKEDERCYLTWGDKENGGFISLSSNIHTVLSGWSGTRPIEDSSREGARYVTPAWEDALPKIEDWIQSDSAQSE